MLSTLVLLFIGIGVLGAAAQFYATLLHALCRRLGVRIVGEEKGLPGRRPAGGDPWPARVPPDATGIGMGPVPRDWRAGPGGDDSIGPTRMPR